MTTFMPRDYPVIEMAIALWSMVPERPQEGDIMATRKPGIGIGLKEANLFLWLLVEGLEAWEFGQLKISNYEPLDPTGQYDPASAYTRYDKHRYCIPMTRLQTVFPSLDLVKVRDPVQAYQPFYTLDTDNNLWLTDRAPFTHEGLIFDKALGVYL